MAVAGTLASTQVAPIPAGDTIGGVSQQVYHTRITTYATFTAGTWLVPHGLPYTPTWCVIIPVLADAVAPATTNAISGFCPADTTVTNLAISLLTLTSAVYDLIYG